MPAETDGKQQHVVEVLNTVDTGTSILVNAQVREGFTAETRDHNISGAEPHFSSSSLSSSSCGDQSIRDFRSGLQG